MGRADAERNRVTVLNATIALLREHGPNVTVEQIAQQTGLGVGTVMRSFGSKANLMDEAVGELLHPIIARVAEPASDADATSALRELLFDLGMFHRNHRVLTPAMTETSATRVNEACQTIFEHVWARFAQCQRLGNVRADLTVNDVVLLVHGIGRVAESSKSEQLRRYVNLIVDGLHCRTDEQGTT